MQQGERIQVEVISQAHSIRRLSFELAYVMEDEDDPESALPGKVVSPGIEW